MDHDSTIDESPTKTDNDNGCGNDNQLRDQRDQRDQSHPGSQASSREVSPGCEKVRKGLNELLTLLAQVKSGQNLNTNTFQRVILELGLAIVRREENHRDLEKRVRTLEGQVSMLKQGMDKVTKGNEENKKRIQEMEVAKAQTQFILKGISHEHSMDDILEDLSTILELDPDCFERTVRLGISAEMKERLKERKQNLVPPILVSCRDKSDVDKMFSRLGYLKGSPYEHIRVNICVPRFLQEENLKLEKRSFEMRKAARASGGGRLSTNVRWRGSDLRLYVKKQGETGYTCEE